MRLWDRSRCVREGCSSRDFRRTFTPSSSMELHTSSRDFFRSRISYKIFEDGEAAGDLVEFVELDAHIVIREVSDEVFLA